MTARGTIALVGILLSSFALTGCITVVQPPKPGLTAAEAAAVEQWTVDNAWADTGLSDTLRPVVSQVQVLDLEALGPAQLRCMLDAGYPDYQQTDEASFAMEDQVPDQQEMIANFACNATYQPDPQLTALNTKQLNYLYRYYRTSLIPCLARAGYPDIGAVPSRAAMEHYTFWNPYYGLPEKVFFALHSDSQLVRMCPATPRGSGVEMQWISDQYTVQP